MREEVDHLGVPRPFLWVSCWAGSFLVYLLLAGNLDMAEATAGGISAVLATLAVVISGNSDYLGRMRLGWWLLLLRRLPGRVIEDTARVVRAALMGRPLRGRLRWVSFDPGGDDPISGSRRALVKAGASLAPNSYAVIIDREHDRMLTHQLVPTDEPPGHGDRSWPV